MRNFLILKSRREEIYLSHDPAKFSGDGSFFAKEIEYLRQHGYKFVKEGDLWHAVQ